jgi:UDP-N-acetylglucosamine 3-dehydrogenase
MESNLKVGAIGCGVIARRGHLPAYRDLGLGIVGVADSDERKAKSCAKKFKINKWYTDYRDLLKEHLDLVSVCTPPSTHCKIAVDAARAGTNVLVEKPMATTSQDAERMIRACKDSGVQLCVVHNYRFFPCVLEAKTRLEEGRIGNVVSVHAVARDYVDVMDTPWRFEKWGVLEDLGPHIIDIVNFLFGTSIDDINVVARDYTGSMGCLTHVQALMLLKSRASVDIDMSWMTGAFELSLKILGTAGTLELDVRNNHLREIHGYSTPLEEFADLLRKTSKIAGAVLNRTYFKGPLLYHQTITREFAKSITDGSKPPVTGEEGRAVVVVMDSIKQSLMQATGESA